LEASTKEENAMKTALLSGAALLLLLLALAMAILGTSGHIGIDWAPVVSFNYSTVHPVERILYVAAAVLCAFGFFAITDTVATRTRGRGTV